MSFWSDLFSKGKQEVQQHFTTPVSNFAKREIPRARDVLRPVQQQVQQSIPAFQRFSQPIQNRFTSTFKQTLPTPTNFQNQVTPALNKAVDFVQPRVNNWIQQGQRNQQQFNVQHPTIAGINRATGYFPAVGLNKWVTKQVPSLIQGTAASIASGYTTATNKSFTPTGSAAKLLYGNKTIEPWQSNDVTRYVEGKGYSPGVAKSVSVPLGALAFAGNIVTGGKGKALGTATKVIAGTKDAILIERTLKGLGVADEMIPKLTKSLTNVNKANDVKAAITPYVKKTVQVTKEIPASAKQEMAYFIDKVRGGKELPTQSEYDYFHQLAKDYNIDTKKFGDNIAMAFDDTLQNTATKGKEFIRNEKGNRYAGSRTVRDVVPKVKGQLNNPMYGGVAGVEQYKDENGNTKFRFNPYKAAAGMAVMGGVNKLSGNDIYKGIAKSNKLEDVTSLLKTTGIDEKAIPTLAKKLVNVSDINKVKNAVSETEKMFPKAPIKSFAQGAATSPDLSRATRETVAATDATFTRRLNNELKTTANSQIDEMGFEQAKMRALDASDITDEGTARAIEVAKRLDSQGLSAEANQVIQANAERALQAGRTVQANALLKRYTPEGVKAQLANMALKAGREINGTKVPIKIKDEVYNTAAQMMTDAQKFEVGSRDYNLAVQKTQEYLKQQFPSSIVDQVLTSWAAGLLTGFKTTGVNIQANLGHGIIRKIADAPSTIADAGLGLISGQRTKTFTFKGILKGVSEGSKEALDYLIHGYDPRKVGSKMQGGTVFSDNKAGKFFKAYTNVVFRFIGAQDRPFSKAAFFNSIADQAGAVAKNKGLKGKAYKDFIEQMLLNPSENIGLRAAKDAEEAVFANDTLIGGLAKKAQDIPGGKAIVPFAKTPSAVVGSVFSYVPGVAPIDEAIKMVRNGTYDQRKLAEAIGKTTVGTGILALGVALQKQGKVNGSYPKDPKAQEIWKAENRQENSIIMPNGVQIQAQSLGPAGNLIVAGAAMQKAREKGEDPSSVLAGQLGATALESPALQGVSQVTDILKNPETSVATKFASAQTAASIPTLVSDVAQATDKAPNGQTNARENNSVIQAVNNRLPYLRTKQPISVNSYGQENTTGKNTFQTLIDPTRSKTLNKSNLFDELNRLGNAGLPTGPAKQDKKISAFNQKLNLTPAQMNDLNRSTGSKIKTEFEKIISSPGYSNLTDDQKSKLLNDTASNLRTEGNKAAIASGGTAPISLTTTNVSTKSGKLSKPELDMAVFNFENSDSSFQDIGNYVLRKDAAGKGVVQTKIAYNTDLTTQKLENAKTNENLNEWAQLYDEQRKNLLTQLDDSSLDELEKMKLEQTLAKLDADAAKYKGYGGFTKPKTGKKKAAISALKNFKVSKISAPSMPSIKMPLARVSSNVKTITASELARGR